MLESDAVSEEQLSATEIRRTSVRSSGNAPAVGIGKQGISRLNTRVADGVSKPRSELVKGSLQLENIL